MAKRGYQNGLFFLIWVLCTGCASIPVSGGRAAADVGEASFALQSVNSSMQRLNETTAELVAISNANTRETRRILSAVEENQIRLDRIERQLRELTATLYKHFELSPPLTGVPAAPVQPVPRRLDIDSEGITVQPPSSDPGRQRVQAPSPTTVTAVPSSVDADTEYRKAQSLYANEEYGLALERFDSFLTRFPNSPRIDNAQYWKAHCGFKMGDYEFAITEFEVLRNRYPRSAKVPIAMHNQAVAYSRLGQNARAEELFQKLIEEYPDDVATEGAREKLKQLQELN